MGESRQPPRHAGSRSRCRRDEEVRRPRRGGGGSGGAGDRGREAAEVAAAPPAGHVGVARADAGLGAAPEATQDRIQAIQEKIAERQRILSLPQHFAGSKPLSRREMEIENALFQGTDRHSFLRMLYRQDEAWPKVAPETGPMAQLDVVYRELLSKPLPGQRLPELLWPSQKAPESSCPAPPASPTAAPGAPGPIVVTEPVACVPEEEILRSRLSKEEICSIPRFSSYSPGEPSKVLYLKNLSRHTTVRDLLPLFSRFQEQDGPPLHFRLLSGRMRGQAFLTFPSVLQAQEALELLNGFFLLGKPLVIEFGRSRTPSPGPGSSPAPGPGIHSAPGEAGSWLDKSRINRVACSAEGGD
ncbi:RNA-binding protein 41 isoform X3 [Candoia aspera]|uniref:RNA-binding protein 41 isoform X3 n=1 Tax=Candoia aspera TaxID=51853 RepID=UPI002FD7E583